MREAGAWGGEAEYTLTQRIFIITAWSLPAASPFQFGGRSRSSRVDTVRDVVDWAGR